MAIRWNFISGSAFLYNNAGASLVSTTIAASAEDVRPTNAAYVDNSGDDTTGNGSRNKPFASLAGSNASIPTNGAAFIGDGVYRATSLSNKSMIGNTKGAVIMEGLGLASFQGSGSTISNFYQNLVFRNYGTVDASPFYPDFYDCTFENIATVNGIPNSGATNIWQNCEFINCGTINLMLKAGSYGNSSINNSFYKCKHIAFRTQANGAVLEFSVLRWIIKDSNIWVQSANSGFPMFSCFDPSNTYRFNASQGTVPTSVPSVGGTPSGYVSYATLAALQAAYSAAFPSDTTGMSYSIMTDPLFNDPNNGDLSLSMSSPVKAWAANGSYIGANRPSPKWNLATDILSVTNFTNTSGILSPTTDSLALVTLKPIDMGMEYEIECLPYFGIIADRNGEAINIVSDVDTVTIAAGTGVLTAAKIYVVETASIVHNGNTIGVNSKFYSGSVLDFTSGGGGVVRLVLNYPNAPTVNWRFKSSLGAVLTNASAIVVGSVYKATGTITHNSIVYTDTMFEAVNTSFTGTGTVQEVFSTSDVYNPFIAAKRKNKCNRTGNVSTGSLTKGDGDYTFDVTTANQFNILARTLQPQIILQVSQLV